MCGIAGFIDKPMRDGREAILRRMCDAIAHRGPDAHGYWSDPGEGVFLGHRRLSIIDITEAGSQPMLTPDGGIAIVFNGEIYNHRDLRERLDRTAGPRWRGGSDTETLIHAIRSFGMEETLRSIRGMFAFAAWDVERRELTLARDRIGEKPLYYGVWDGRLLFSSELKSFFAIPGFQAPLDMEALSLYFRYGSVPEPHCILKGVRKLTPGCYLTVRCGEDGVPVLSECKPYWSVREQVAANPVDPALTLESATDRLEAMLHESIEEQSISDVSLGAFLSGGVDSSIVCAILREKMNTRLKTFTIGFEVSGFDESEHARRVAEHLGTEHHEMFFGKRQVLDIVPGVADIYCEPFSDSSQLPTILLSRFSREHVTVSLSGDAGDELFGGYSRYRYSVRMRDRLAPLPFGLRRVIGSALGSLSTDTLSAAVRGIRRAAGNDREPTLSWMQKLSGIFGSRDVTDIYDVLMTHWRKGSILKVPTSDAPLYPAAALEGADIPDIQRIMASDILGYLCSDILVKVDRAAMAASLETRIPLLDHRIVSFAQTLPLSLKVSAGEGKPVLKRLLGRYIPQELYERPKSGFAVPVAEWLRTDLREWASEMLSPRSLRDMPFLDADLVSKGWNRHLERKSDWSTQLWDVLMFIQWYRRYGAGISTR